MQEEILNILLKETFTQILLKHRLRILKSRLLKSFFGNKIEEELSPADVNWLNSLPPTFYQNFNQNNVYQIFEAIEAKVNSMPVLIIYVPFEADDQTNYQIGTALRKNFTSSFLFDTKFNPTLIAGCALSFQGVYRDYSLKTKIEEKKEEILKSFKKFLR